MFFGASLIVSCALVKGLLRRENTKTEKSFNEPILVGLRGGCGERGSTFGETECVSKSDRVTSTRGFVCFQYWKMPSMLFLWDFT